MKYLFIAILFASCHRKPKLMPANERKDQFHVAVVSFGAYGAKSNLYVIHATNDNWQTFVDVTALDEGFNDHTWISDKETMCRFASQHVKNWDSVLRINAKFDSLIRDRRVKAWPEKMDTACIR